MLLRWQLDPSGSLQDQASGAAVLLHAVLLQFLSDQLPGMNKGITPPSPTSTEQHSPVPPLPSLCHPKHHAMLPHPLPHPSPPPWGRSDTSPCPSFSTKPRVAHAPSPSLLQPTQGSPSPIPRGRRGDAPVPPCLGLGMLEQRQPEGGHCTSLERRNWMRVE